jgi:hypothetical protein
MTIIYITILTEDLLNGVYRTIIYITIPTEVFWNGVQMTIIDITIPTDVHRRRTDNTMVKRKSTKDKLRSTKHTHKTKDRVTRTPLKIEGELRSPGHHS